MNQVLAELKGKEFKVCDMKKESAQKAPLPFTTSTLQQEASKALNFPDLEDDAECTAAV